MKAPNLHHSLSKSMQKVVCRAAACAAYTLKSLNTCLHARTANVPVPWPHEPLLPSLFICQPDASIIYAHWGGCIFPAHGDFEGLLADFLYMDHNLASTAGQNQQPLWPHFSCLPADLRHRSTLWLLEGQCAANRCSTTVSPACLSRI